MRRSDKLSRVKETSQRNEASTVSSRSPTRQEGHSLFRNEGSTDQQMRTRPGIAALRLSAVDDGVGTLPHSEPGVDSQVLNLMKEMGCSSDDHISINQAKNEESCQTECVKHSPVSKTTLAPPPPSADPILKSKAVVLRTRQVPPEKSSACSNMDADHENCSEEYVVSDIPTLETNQSRISEFSAATTPSSIEENGCVGRKAQGDTGGDENKNILTDFTETEVALIMDPTFKALHNKGDVSLSKDSSIETKPELSELHSVTGETSCKPQELVKLRIHKEEVGRKADKIQDKIQDHFCECSERKKQTSGDPVQILKDWSRLKKMIQSLAANISRTSRDSPGSLTQQISHVEEILKNIAEIVTDQQDTGNQEFKSNAMGLKPALEHEVPVKDIPDMGRTPTDPEHMEPSAAREEGSVASFARSHSNPVVMSCSEEFLLVEPHTKMAEPDSDQGLAVAKNTQSQHMSLRNSDLGRSSKIRRLIVITTEEIKMMSVPELVLMNLPEGRVEECGPTNKSTGWNTEDPEEELPVGDIDSCEEVVEDATQQLATQEQATQQHHPTTGFSAERICPETSCVNQPRGKKRLSSDSRKDQKQTDCKIS